MSDRINRREFIKRGAVTGAGAGLTLGMSRRAGAAFNNADSPNGRVTLGFIGTGARAHQVLDDVAKVPGYEVVALCDAYKGRLDLFSNYGHNPQNVDLFMSNILQVKLSKVLSATWGVDLIYDDDVRLFGRNGTSAAMQIKSLVGLGLLVKF